MPTGWAPLGPGSSATAPGIYSRPEDFSGTTKQVPIMVMLQNTTTKHAVIAVRGSNTKAEWAYSE